jgi:preprotein translocase subunit SecA
VAAKSQGKILGSITLQHLIALYPQVCGMTGTASTQALEFHKIYGLRVETIPTNRPVIRIDHPDAVFATKARERSKPYSRKSGAFMARVSPSWWGQPASRNRRD